MLLNFFIKTKIKIENGVNKQEEKQERQGESKDVEDSERSLSLKKPT